MHILENLSTEEIDKQYKKLLPIGSSRTVYDIGQNQVIKIVNDQQKEMDNYQCKSEIEIYESDFSKELKCYLCPIIDWYTGKDGCMRVIMQKAAELSNDVPLFIYGFSDEIKNVCDKLVEIHRLQKADLMNKINWGRINEQYVIVDYGLTEECYQLFYRNV